MRFPHAQKPIQAPGTQDDHAQIEDDLRQDAQGDRDLMEDGLGGGMVGGDVEHIGHRRPVP